jgi:hypothetical protein
MSDPAALPSHTRSRIAPRPDASSKLCARSTAGSAAQLPRWVQSGGFEVRVIEGEWEPVFQAIKACHQAVHTMGYLRINTTVKINTRIDKDQTLEDKVTSVQSLL